MLEARTWSSACTGQEVKHAMEEQQGTTLNMNHDREKIFKERMIDFEVAKAGKDKNPLDMKTAAE